MTAFDDLDQTDEREERRAGRYRKADDGGRVLAKLVWCLFLLCCFVSGMMVLAGLSNRVNPLLMLSLAGIAYAVDRISS